MRLALIILLACWCAAAHAERKVYKCSKADGSSVFSPYPCGTGAQEVKVDTSATPAPPPAATQQANPVQSAAPAESPVEDADDLQCRSDAQRLKVYPAEANLGLLQERQTELLRSYSANASDAIEIQIGNLDAKIAAEQARLNEERQHADRAYAEAIARCDARKTARAAAAHP